MELAILTDEIALDLDEALREGKALGFRKYEIRCIGSYDHRVPFIETGAEERILKEIANGEIEILALSPGTFKIDLSDTARLKTEMEEVLPKTCEMAVRMKAPIVNVFAFMREDGIGNNDVAAKLAEAGRIAAGFGLELSVENEPGSYCDTGVNTAEVIRTVAMENVGINWDPGNALSSGEAAFPVGYDAVKPYIKSMHIKDTIPVPPDRWENRLIGDGGVNWLGQLHAAVKDGILPHLTLETHVFPLLESTREDLRRLRILLQVAEDFYSMGDPS